MNYIENETWSAYYKETDEKKRKVILDELLASEPDDGANELRKKLYEFRYVDQKKPGKRVDKGLWEMVVMPSYLSGFFTTKSKIQKFIRISLKNLGINEEIKKDEVLASAVYWEIRNIARRFYETCQSPSYGRKFFGITESSWDEKQVRCGRDVWIMTDVIADKFDMREEMKIFIDAVCDQFYEVSDKSEQILQDIRVNIKVPRFPIIIDK